MWLDSGGKYSDGACKYSGTFACDKAKTELHNDCDGNTSCKNLDPTDCDRLQFTMIRANECQAKRADSDRICGCLPYSQFPGHLQALVQLGNSSTDCKKAYETCVKEQNNSKCPSLEFSGAGAGVGLGLGLGLGSGAGLLGGLPVILAL
jgi:hypothetical protein